MKQTTRLFLASLLFIIYAVWSLPSYSQAGNLMGVLLPSAARTATQTTSADITNLQWRGGHFIITFSSLTSGTFTPVVEGKDSVTGNYYTILTGTAITASGTTILKVYPGIAPIAGGASSDLLPKTFRFKMTATGSPNATYSVGSALEQ